MRMHRVRKPGTRPSDHAASAMQPPTKTIPAASDEPTPADHPRQPPMHRVRKPGARALNHAASAMQPPTKTIPAVSDEPAPADRYHQPRNFTSIQADPPDPRKAPPPSRLSGSQLWHPILGRQLVKLRFARLLVAAVHLDR